MPQKNSRAERSNRHVLEGTLSLLEASGVPQRFWTYAASYFCLCCNAWNWKDKEGSETSPYFMRFGEKFEFPLIPFGSLIDSMPNKTNPRQPNKVGTMMRPAVFLGYKTEPGGRCLGQVHSIELELLKAGLDYHTSLVDVPVTAEPNDIDGLPPIPPGPVKPYVDTVLLRNVSEMA